MSFGRQADHKKIAGFRRAESEVPQSGMFNSVERNARLARRPQWEGTGLLPKSQTIKGLERGLQVLQFLQSNPISSLHEVHTSTKISKPSLLRILHTLERSGLVSRRLGDGRYRVSANLTRMARRRAGYDRIAEAAAPVLDRLCQQISWPSDLLVPAGDHMEIVETSQTHSPFLIKVSGIGQPVNWLLSAVGRVYLAFGADKEREAILQRLRKSDKPEDRLAAIAIPLLDRTRVHGSVNILWIKTAFTIEEFAERHLADLRAAAAEIVDSLRASTRTGKRR